MPRKRQTAEEIIHKLSRAEISLAKGLTTGRVVRQLGVTKQIDYRWRKKYRGMKVDQARRLRELEKENARLKRLLADAHLDNAILTEAAERNS